jgi:two-component system, OmpR family, phosphate regulon sensor histidine kinase PhoR
MLRSKRIVLYCALFALVLLGTIQVFWFLKTKDLHNSQFDTRMTLVLREVADGVLRAQKDLHSDIPPVSQIASNSFLVTMPAALDYQSLDSLLRSSFIKHEVNTSFELALYDQANMLVRGNIYQNADEPNGGSACMGRDTDNAAMSFSVTFPDKDAEVLASMDLWMFSAVTISFLVVLFGVVLIDVSRQRKLALMKNEFISNMTHELKSPITNIAMAGHVLQQSEQLPPQKKKRYLDIIVEENERLKTQVEQVLLTASFDENDFELLKKPVDINRLIRNVIERFQIRIDHREGKISTDLRATEPLIAGDETHLTNALLNLLDNAEKYSPGKLHIEVVSEDRDGQVLISVSDKGMGISSNQQSMVFERFFRGATGNVHDVKGFGLGLSYVKKIIEGHSGIISVKSRLNEGSLFTIVLPKA